MKIVGIEVFYQWRMSWMPTLPADVVAVKGRCRFVSRGSDLFGNGLGYVSSIVENPTGKDLQIIANEAMECTGDSHHRFLEGWEELGRAGDVTTYKLLLGS